MRITSGELGGRLIQAPKTRETRPMTEKMRAALFDVMGDIEGAEVLDVYAGSGAIGFEALSRGAHQVVAIESNNRVAATISKNQQDLGLEWGYSLYKTSVEKWLARWASEQQGRYRLIVADPPYDRLEVDVLEKLMSLLGDDGVLAVSHSSRMDSPGLVGSKLLSSKVYGDSALSFYSKA